MSRFKALGDEISPLVASGDPIDLIRAQQATQRAQVSEQQRAAVRSGGSSRRSEASLPVRRVGAIAGRHDAGRRRGASGGAHLSAVSGRVAVNEINNGNDALDAVRPADDTCALPFSVGSR